MVSKNRKADLNANTPHYTLFVRMSGDSREMLKEAQKRLADRLGDVPSNGYLIDEILRRYLGR